MAFGPIDLIVVEFKGYAFDKEIIDSVADFAAVETIRILDLVIVQKNELGEVIVKELKELSRPDLQMLEPLRAEISGMITVDDIRMIGIKLKKNTTAAIMLFENLWAIRLKQDVIDVGGRLVMHERISREIVSEALRDLAEYD
jgi:uncharacterized protein DUF6325